MLQNTSLKEQLRDLLSRQRDSEHSGKAGEAKLRSDKAALEGKLADTTKQLE